MIRTPLNNGLLQSHLDFAGFKPLNADLSDYDLGGSATNVLITINVKDAPYNAAGNGTTDDSAAINAAIAAVVSVGGGTVFFPKGIYLCNGAFDALFNCIVKIPMAATPITVELIGEEHPPWGVFTTFNLANASTIRTTKTGTGSYPALLAGSQGRGPVIVPDYTTMSNTLVKIRNLNFILPDNPSLHGVRLDGVGQAFVEDSNVMVEAQNAATAFVEPTHGTTGLWMPNSINFSMNWVKHVTVTGFDTGFMTGEHLRAPFMQAFNCKNGVTFLESMYPSWANICLGNCVEGIRFLGYHTVDLLVETEHAPSGWMSAAHDIKDPSNQGTGRIRYYVGHGAGSLPSTAATVEGGTGLTIIDLCSGSIGQNATQGASSSAGLITGNIFARNLLYIGYTDTTFARLAAGVLEATSVIRYKPVTFANLPSSGGGSIAVGEVAHVSDAAAGLALGANVSVGGGSTHYLIWWNGTNWTVIGK